ncbi:MAG: hypothetical protein ACHQJ6_06220 [Candidatus Berkiellales bacterium]
MKPGVTFQIGAAGTPFSPDEVKFFHPIYVQYKSDKDVPKAGAACGSKPVAARFKEYIGVKGAENKAAAAAETARADAKFAQADAKFAQADAKHAQATQRRVLADQDLARSSQASAEASRKAREASREAQGLLDQATYLQQWQLQQQRDLDADRAAAVAQNMPHTRTVYVPGKGYH